MHATGFRLRVLHLLAVIAPSVAVLGAGCSSPPANRPEAVRPVKTVVVISGDEPHFRTFPGKVEASKRVELAFQVAGRLLEFPVKEGQKVAKGELIGRLRQDEFKARLKTLQSNLDKARADLTALRSGDRPEQQRRLDAQLRAAQVKLANATAEFDRDRRLFAQRAVTREEFDRSQAAFRVAREELNVAREAREKGTVARQEDIEAKEAVVRGIEAQVVEANLQLEDTTLLAPYDGVIAKTFVRKKEEVQARQPIVRFQDIDEIDISVDVPETFMAADLRTADIIQKEAAFSAVPGLQFPVRIREIAQKADPVTQTFRVSAGMKVPEGLSLLPGMTATVTITYRRSKVIDSRILVPISAVFKESSGEQVVWAINKDLTVERRPVKIGEATGDRIEILSGLQPGERIAVAGVAFLREGMKVRDLGDALGGSQP